MNMPASDDWAPLAPEEDRVQRRALRRLLPRRALVLDLGAGEGRVAYDLAVSGRRVLAVDRDARALRRCAARHEGITPRRGDFLSPRTALTVDGVAPAAAMCLGHTFMTLHDADVTLGFLRRLEAVLPPGAPLYLDDLPALWSDVASGNWQTGLSADGAWQLVWAEGDNVVALRRGSAVAPRSWKVRKSDALLRLWSLGELRLLARAAGWRGPVRLRKDCLIRLTRP
ncbi:MAG: methyltransferase domain-containing protein [Planctomycetota bacterium]|nr:methyltransferase domain-containing protein [Planctomycetota bacterium]